jgi:hypothetical protein
MKILTQPRNKLNETALILELQAVQADAKVIIHPVTNWNRFPYRDNLKCPDHITPPDDIDAAWTSPFYIEIANGDEANRADFETAIEAHDPQFTEQEERINAINQQRAQELLDALLTLPDQYLAQIKARFDALP